MSAKMHEDLKRQLKEHAAAGVPEGEIPIIVTVREWEGTAELEHHGLRVGHTFESVSAISGKASPADIARIAELENVTMIEYDGEMRAL